MPLPLRYVFMRHMSERVFFVIFINGSQYDIIVTTLYLPRVALYYCRYRHAFDVIIFCFTRHGLLICATRLRVAAFMPTRDAALPVTPASRRTPLIWRRFRHATIFAVTTASADRMSLFYVSPNSGIRHTTATASLLRHYRATPPLMIHLPSFRL